MKYNFFKRAYFSELERRDEIIGICDPVGERHAYTTTDINCPDKWCATIDNPQKKQLRFTAIDKNIVIKRDNGELESTCDGMIYATETRELSFVELKDWRTSGAMKKAVSQLSSTLKVFLANHDYSLFNNRRAHACNPSHPYFKHSYRELSSEFMNKYHFRLYTEAKIPF